MSVAFVANLLSPFILFVGQEDTTKAEGVRTQTTAKVNPLAKEKGIDVLEYNKIEEMDALLKKYQGGTLVICGHSNTVPALANYLIGKDSYQAFEDSDYGNILIVSVAERGKNTNVVWLNY